MEVRCAFNDCKHNIKNGDGFWCTLNVIHLYSYWSSLKPKEHKCICEQYQVVEGFAPSSDMTHE